jgi:hypothetical protein
MALFCTYPRAHLSGGRNKIFVKADCMKKSFNAVLGRDIHFDIKIDDKVNGAIL